MSDESGGSGDFDLLRVYLEAGGAEADGVRETFVEFGRRLPLLSARDVVSSLVVLESIWGCVSEEERVEFLASVAGLLPGTPAVYAWLQDTTRGLSPSAERVLWSRLRDDPKLRAAAVNRLRALDEAAPGG